MLVGRWWVEHGLESDGWRAGRKVQQDSRPQQQIGLHIAHLERGATTIMALQKWGGRGSDDIGAAVLREENDA